MGSLHKWFKSSKSVDGKPGWVEVISGEPCAREEGEKGTPKCVSSDKRASMTKKERISAQRRKSAADPNQPEKSGAEKPTYVSTDKPKKKMNEEKDKPGKGSGKKDACYTKVKSRYDVWPSAYASGALTKCRKVGAANWGNKTEEMEMIRYCPKCGKDETRKECRYGSKYWDMFSIPSALTSNQLKYDIAQVHPANEEKQPDHEHSMARSELSTIVSAAKRLRKKLNGEGNIEAWVQSKITKAADYIDAAADYLDSGEHDVHGSMNENVSFEIGHTSADTRKAIRQDKLMKRAESGQQGADVARKKLTGIQLPLANSTDLKTFGEFMQEALDKSKMKCNSPKSDPVGDSLTGKSHVVKACEGGKEKIIRFGQRGVKGSPKKKGESEAYANRRKRFQTRHAKNIAKGKMSAAYWANKAKW
jgi:ribosomal protein L33